MRIFARNFGTNCRSKRIFARKFASTTTIGIAKIRRIFCELSRWTKIRHFSSKSPEIRAFRRITFSLLFHNTVVIVTIQSKMTGCVFLTMTFLQPFSGLANFGNKVTFIFTRFISNIKVVKDFFEKTYRHIFWFSHFLFRFLFFFSFLLQVNVQLFRAQVKYPLDVQRLLRERLTSASYLQSIKSPLF